MRKRDANGVIILDDNTSLFATKPATRKSRKTKKVVTPAVASDLISMDLPDEDATATSDPVKRRKRSTKKKVSTNPNIPKYSIKSPSDCKHILPAFKKLLNVKWKLIEEGTYTQGMDVSAWIRGVSNYLKDSRPKEHEELKLLFQLAKGLAEDKNLK